MSELDDLLEVLEAGETRHTFRKMDFFSPYDKQRAFLNAGATFRERLFMAGNQLGKTETGAFEVACHLTGDYPSWWMGRRWDRPTRGWASGETSLLARDVSQNKLCGPPGVEAGLGTGYIPKEAFVEKPSLARGVTDAFDTAQVRHKSGGISTLTFKSYEQGRTKFQGEPIDFGWNDEEPPMEIYSEILTRTTATGGLVFTTFTPLEGKTDLVTRFMDEHSPDRALFNMVIEEALHIPAEKRAAIIAGYPAHEREARARGVPMLGSGRIFLTSEDAIAEPYFSYIPTHWTKLWSIDFGIGHPFAAVLSLWDKDNDVFHVHHCFKVADQLPIMHAAAMKPIGIMVPVAWPHDGTQREKTSGDTLAAAYKKHELIMLPEHATWPDGGISTEAGVVEMDERMKTNRFKVASHLHEWFDEYRQYHRKDGLIVKVRDDLLSATRIGIMMKRHGRIVPLGRKKTGRRDEGMARDVDFDLF